MIQVPDGWTELEQLFSPFKTEISRIAKKESRAQAAVLKKAQATHRAGIAHLKTLIASLEAVVRRSAKTPSRTAAKEEAEPQGLCFRVNGFASLRKKFGLSGA